MPDDQPHTRYRIEGGVPSIDVRVADVDQIFDKRDPAPFRSRDLDPDLVDYLQDAAEDLAKHPEYRVVFWVENPCSAEEVVVAFRAQIEYLLERAWRRRLDQRRTGRVSLAVALLLAGALFTVSQLVGTSVRGSLGATLREGLVVLTWIVMWRPVEVLLYDGIPVRRERHVLRRLLAAKIDVRAGVGPDAAAAVTARPA
jgi:hypothetical protein